MGKAGRSSELPEKIIKMAESIGREIAKRDCILVTGACMGIADIAAKAASKEKGLVFSYSPAKDLTKHLEPPISYPQPTDKTELIFTGQGKIGRNVLSIIGCDGVIFVGGGIGTLNEFSIAYHENKVIGILEGVGSIIEKILKFKEDFQEGTKKEFKTVIIKEKEPKKLVEKVIKEIEKREEKKRKEIPITFKNERNKELMGILHLPENEKPPVVIISHGFQGTKTSPYIIKLARTLQKEGILVFRFDFEGCGDSEGDAKEITVEREASDLNLALKTVLKECDVNSKKIGFVGHSLGAVVVSFFLKKYKIEPSSLVFWSPAFHQKELFKIWYESKDSKKIKKKGYLIKGSKEIGRAYYLENEKKDSSFLLSGLDLPILIIHGKEDEDVPLKFSRKLAQKYKNIFLKILSKANHKFEDFQSQKKLISQTVKWLKRDLLNK